jgi:gluconate 2-dehydrogenase gamma chain
MDQDESVEVLEETPLLDTPVSRRRFLAITGIGIGALALGPTLAGCDEDTEGTTDTTGTATTGEGGATTTAGGDTTETTTGDDHGPSDAVVQPLVTLTVAEANLLGAVVDRLIPADDVGPSASEAGVVGYIDRALQEEDDRGAGFRSNLQAIDAWALQSQGSDFAGLDGQQQDSVLTAVQNDEGTGFTPGSGLFFMTLRSYTLQGLFGDPFYGGNRDFAGWELLRYGGIRLNVPAEHQELDFEPELLRMSMYEYNQYGYRIQGG